MANHVILIAHMYSNPDDLWDQSTTASLGADLENMQYVYPDVVRIRAADLNLNFSIYELK